VAGIGSGIVTRHSLPRPSGWSPPTIRHPQVSIPPSARSASPPASRSKGRSSRPISARTWARPRRHPSLERHLPGVVTAIQQGNAAQAINAVPPASRAPLVAAVHASFASALDVLLVVSAVLRLSVRCVRVSLSDVGTSWSHTTNRHQRRHSHWAHQCDENNLGNANHPSVRVLRVRKREMAHCSAPTAL